MISGADTCLSQLVDLVHSTVCALVDDEMAVSVRVIVVAGVGAEAHVTVEQRDYRRVVGRHGRNIDALRLLASACGCKWRLPAVAIHVIDPDPSRRGAKTVACTSG